MDKILIVDDEPTNLEMIIKCLDSSGSPYEIYQATNGRIACKAALKKQPDLIIMDWEMPEMSGIETVQYLKGEEDTQDIPIIMSTGVMTSPQHLETALNAGAIDYIRKPIDKTELLARINSVLKLSKSYKEIREKKEEVEELYREQNDLMSIVAHDLKSPLNKVLGLTQLIPLGGDLNEEQKSYIEMLNKVIQGGRKLIDDILTISAYEAHTEKPDLEELSLNELIRKEVLDTYHQQATKKNITIHFEKHSEDIQILTEKESLVRILDNLLSNAIKFSHEGSNVYVKVESVERGAKITIEDEGQGISMEDQKKMFKKFQKLSAQPTGGETSTGLGLSIIKALIQKLKGNITFKSEVGKGTSFWLHLPSSEE